ncbi:MAG TPA: hypothetical protein VMK66_02530 [Myxococcales bacterium]|nr:hypothetical protein [Myxococcales bacterium]
MSGTRGKVAPYAGASAAACVLGIGGALLIPGAARSVALHGVLAASLGALCALWALARSSGKGVNGLLTGFGIGFLCRALLLAAGLLAGGARDNLALVYVAAFFTLYVPTQVIEVLFVHKSSHPQGVPQ